MSGACRRTLALDAPPLAKPDNRDMPFIPLAPQPTQGLHLTADLHGCSANQPWMTDMGALKEACIAGVARVGLNAVGDCFHAFAPAKPGQSGGVTGMVLLAESHLAVHTWPESGLVTLDVFVCNVGVDNSERAHALMDALVQGFEPGSVHRQSVRRGMALAAST